MKLLNRGRLIVAYACAATATLALAVAAGAAPAAKNLLVNGNAEQGEASEKGYDVVAEVPGWVRKGKFTVVRYGAPDFPDPSLSAKLGGGANFFAGGPENVGSAISQDVDVAAQKGLIDAGKAKATLSGYIGGYATQNDSLVATALFRSASGKQLGKIRIGPVESAARKTVTGMLKQTATSTVPAKTRVIRVVLAATRSGGAYNDGYADNLSLTITR